MQSIVEKLYPEASAGGYSRDDHRMEFILRVNALLRPSMTVLDFGAGRGKWIDDPVPLRRWLGDLRGRCAKLVVCDVDEAVLDNPQADERVLIEHDAPLPFGDASFDLVSTFSVFEHVDEPRLMASELDRILKPGGWICGWTPNKWGYVGIGARLVPKRFHATVLRLVEPRRVEVDSFVPLYRMNTLRTLRTLFPPARFRHFTYPYDGQPFYHGERAALARFWQFVFRLTPAPFKGFYMVFIQKREDA